MKIVWLSDLDLMGSGYMNISMPLLSGLVENGHEVVALGLGYNGAQHDFDFPIIPANRNLLEAQGAIINMEMDWKFDILIVALDIPLQAQYLSSFPTKSFKYYGIMPIEAPPLSLSWAMTLRQMDKVFIISQFGTDEATNAGIEAEHLVVGVDRESWKPPTPEERSSVRSAFGFREDEFVVLTVADNQERKNLSRAMEIYQRFKLDNDAVSRYAMVTREHLPFGWNLRDFAFEKKISTDLLVFERGLPFQQLWSLYAAADAFLLPSKAEGLGMPVLESMSVRVPVVGTNCTGIREHLQDGRGFLIDYDYDYRDPFGNEKRYFAGIESGAAQLTEIYKAYKKSNLPQLDVAEDYIKERKWANAVAQLEKSLHA